MGKIATNDVFCEVCLLLRIHKDKDYLIELFKSIGWSISKSKLKSWSTRTYKGSVTGAVNKDFRPMPEEALRGFLKALSREKLVEELTNVSNE